MIRIKSVIGLLVAVLLLVTFSAPGAAQSPGKICVDRSHGQDLVNITQFTAALVAQEWIVDELTEPTTIDILGECDVFLVLRPSAGEPFQDPEEVNAIRSYVESGGGLWMLDESATTESLSNPVAQLFGVTFGADTVTDDLSNDGDPIKPIIDQTYNAFPFSHPVTAGVDSFLYDEGCSVGANFPAQVIARASMYSAAMESGLFGDVPVLAAADLVDDGYETGGRAVFIGDMTPLGNYDSLSDDHKLLLANIVTWLSEPELQLTSEAPNPPVQVTINVRPWRKSNRINLKSRWVTPVALITDDACNATDADPETVHFAGAAPVRWIALDVDRDRDKDVLFFFRTRALELTEKSVQATMTGEFKDGTAFEGTDMVQCVPKKWKRFKVKWKRGRSRCRR